MKSFMGLIALSLMLGMTSCSFLQTQTIAAGHKKTPSTATAPTKKSPTIANNDGALPGEWVVYSVNGVNVVGDERPYLTFDSSNNRFYGNNGCNTINGDYIVSGNHLTLSNIISTMRACEYAPFEIPINQALNNAATFSIANTGNESYMTIFDASGKSVMVIRKHNMDYLNGSWQVTSLNNKPIDVNEHPDMQLVIDIPELRVHGNTPCNILNGNLLIDPDKANAFQFTNMAVTLRACSDDALETEYLLALESVDHARNDGHDRVTLLNENGTPVLTLKRINQ